VAGKFLFPEAFDVILRGRMFPFRRLHTLLLSGRSTLVSHPGGPLFLRTVALSLVVLSFAADGFAITRSWTGATSAAWSESSNWSPAGVPASVDKLVFPVGVTRTSMINDLPAGTSFGAMDFRAGYTLSGNAMTLIGDLTFDQSTYPNFVCNADLTLGAPVRFGAAITSVYTGAIHVNGQTLTIDSYNTSLNGPLHGTGTVHLSGSGVSIAGSGTFTGTIQGTLDIAGAIPGAATNGTLSGTGTVGAATINGSLYLGGKMPCCGDTHAIGTLHTGSLSMNAGSQFFYDLAPAAASDLLRVAGSVVLNGSSLFVTLVSGAPSAGQTFLVIDNDGNDAVSGTFAGLSEGAAVPASGASLTISYKGGDGNDVVLTAGTSVKQWTGAASAFWSNPANWSPASVPAAGEALVFPAGVSRTDMQNDLLAGTQVGTMDFRQSYSLSGNALTLLGDLEFDQSGHPNFVCNVPLTLGGSSRFGAANTSTFNGAIDVNGRTVTIDSYNTTINGSLTGTGAIVVTGSGVSVSSSGAFSGTIQGTIDLVGSMPKASLVAGGLSGSGTLGSVSTTSAFYLGSKMPCCGDGHSIGTLQTGSVTIGSAFFVDLAGTGASDLLSVTGSVTLSGQPLVITLVSGTPSSGQVFTLIENDGNDAVSGTFDQRPEGSTISLGGTVLTLSYKGGDGNDVVLSAGAGTKSWTGAVSAQWSNAANWSPAVAPIPGEPLIFPAGVARTDMTNDLPAGFVVGPLDFRTSYTLSGNPLTVSGSWTFDQQGNTFVCNVDLELATAVTLGAANTSTYAGAIDVNGQMLTIDSYNTTLQGALNGSGSIAILGSGISVTGSGNFSGLLQGSFELHGALPAASVVGGVVSGTGSIGTLTLSGGSPYGGGALYPGGKPPCCADTHAVGTLQTKSVNLAGPLHVDLVGGGTADLLSVTGAVALSSELLVTIPSGSPDAGQTFSILENDGTDAIQGTFTGYAEGSFVAQAPWKFRLTYAGGDGNDVVLTTVDDTVTESTQEAASTRVGEKTTFTANVSSRVHVPVGSVTFTDNGSVIDTVPLVNGTARLAYAAQTPGTHTIGASYQGTPIFAPSVSQMSHVVLRGQSATTAAPASPSVIYGDGTDIVVNVNVAAPASGTATGRVTLRLNGTSLGVADLRHGQATLPAPMLDAGTYSMTASYEGDDRVEGSESLPTPFEVRRAMTAMNVVADPRAGKLSIDAFAAHQPSLPAIGSVIVTNDNVLVTQGSLNGSKLELPISLPNGMHTLKVTYVGSNNFESAETTVSYRVGSTGTSKRRSAGR
jgi:fibronectin-binding autotransporter adhesin